MPALASLTEDRPPQQPPTRWVTDKTICAVLHSPLYGLTDILYQAK
jgi:hypothetical protein